MSPGYTRQSRLAAGERSCPVSLGLRLRPAPCCIRKHGGPLRKHTIQSGETPAEAEIKCLSLLCATEQYQHQKPVQNSPRHGFWPHSWIFCRCAMCTRRINADVNEYSNGIQIMSAAPTISWRMKAMMQETAKPASTPLKVEYPTFSETTRNDAHK